MITRTSICACSSILSAIRNSNQQPPTHPQKLHRTPSKPRTSSPASSKKKRDSSQSYSQNPTLTSYSVSPSIKKVIPYAVYQSALIDRFSEDHINTLKFQGNLSHTECLLDRTRSPSLDSIIGHDYAKEQISDIIKFISLPKISKMPHLHSVLLYGPPGVGKTQLALSLLGNNDITCLEFSMPVLHSKYIGGFEKYLLT
jgi:ATP-dependent Zn protease